MKVYIASPIFDGMVPIQYVHGLLDTIMCFLREKIDFVIGHETKNLISQSRNRCAHAAMKLGCDKLLFIDSDIAFKGQDVLRLVKSKKKIVGGVYPLKAFPVRLNFVPPLNLGLPEHFDYQEFMDKYKDEDGEVEVFKLATGFLCIDTSVLKEIEPYMETYHHVDPITHIREDERMFFPVKIGEDGFLHTEDWGFCEEVQKIGYKVYWNTKVIVDHVGKHQFSAITPVDKSYKPVNLSEKVQETMVRNPFLDWPRNSACYCGSGKKFKKCCIDVIFREIPKSMEQQAKEEFQKASENGFQPTLINENAPNDNLERLEP